MKIKPLNVLVVLIVSTIVIVLSIFGGTIINKITADPLLTAQKMERELVYAKQHDADILRLEHLAYWTGIVEEYHEKTGSYPFQEQAKTSGKIALVRIATKNQQEYFSKDSPKYSPKNDNNPRGFFAEKTMKDFVAEIESKLGRPIDEKYDILETSPPGPNYYAYFTSNDGYVFWVKCLSCGVTPISTLLMDASVATVNIVSDGMAGKVTKALTRDKMLNHPTFKKWIDQKINDEQTVRNEERAHYHDSKE